MLKAWFKGCLVEILALRDCLDNAKTTLNAILWPGCGQLSELYVICPQKCRGLFGLKRINPD